MRFVAEPHGAQCSRAADRLQDANRPPHDFSAPRARSVAFVQQPPLRAQRRDAFLPEHLQTSILQAAQPTEEVETRRL